LKKKKKKKGGQEKNPKRNLGVFLGFAGSLRYRETTKPFEKVVTEKNARLPKEESYHSTTRKK